MFFFKVILGVVAMQFPVLLNLSAADRINEVSVWVAECAL